MSSWDIEARRILREHVLGLSLSLSSSERPRDMNIYRLASKEALGEMIAKGKVAGVHPATLAEDVLDKKLEQYKDWIGKIASGQEDEVPEEQQSEVREFFSQVGRVALRWGVEIQHKARQQARY